METKQNKNNRSIIIRLSMIAFLILSFMSCNSNSKNAEIQINNEEDLIAFARSLKSGEYKTISGEPIYKIVRLNNDIEITRPFLPIGDAAHPFYGYFDGKGHSIKNISVSADSANMVAMFGFVKDSQIQNIKLENVYIKGSSNVGGLCAYGYGSLFMNCSVAGYVEGRKCVGGLLGEANYCTADDCSFSGTIKGTEYSIGGIMGSSEFGAAVRCSTAGTIYGEQDVHELVGTSVDGLRFENVSTANIKQTRTASHSYDKLSKLLFSAL